MSGRAKHTYPCCLPGVLVASDAYSPDSRAARNGLDTGPLAYDEQYDGGGVLFDVAWSYNALENQTFYNWYFMMLDWGARLFNIELWVDGWDGTKHTRLHECYFDGPPDWQLHGDRWRVSATLRSIEEVGIFDECDAESLPNVPDPLPDLPDLPELPPPCKQYECDAYENAMLAFNPHSLWTFTGGLSETDGSLNTGATIYDRMGNNDLYVDSRGNSYFFTDGVVPDDCGGDQAIGINSGNGTGLRRNGTDPWKPRADLPSTGEGIIGCVAKKSSDPGKCIYAEWTKTDTESSGGSISLGGFTGGGFIVSAQTLRFNGAGVYQGASVDSMGVAVPAYAGGTSSCIQVVWKTTGGGDSAETTFTAYAYWDRSIVYGTLVMPGEVNTSDNIPHGSELNIASNMIRLNHVFIKGQVPSAAAWDAMADAWAQNQIGYTDPNPDCTP